MEAAVKRFAVTGPVVGICGGFQMMGSLISDPDMVEEGGTTCGMELFNLKTVLSNEKYRSQTEDCFDDLEDIFSCLAGEEFVGYEIHNGVTTLADDHFTGIIERDDEGNIILVQQGNLLGTYVHGIFDNSDLALRLVSAIAETKGKTLDTTLDYQAFMEASYDKLVEVVRNNIDMEFIYNLL